MITEPQEMDKIRNRFREKMKNVLKNFLKHPANVRGASHHSDEWRLDYADGELEIIDLYNEICVPNGWRPVNKYSEQLQNALEIVSNFDAEELWDMLETAVDDRKNGDGEYNTRLGNKLIRILQHQR